MSLTPAAVLAARSVPEVAGQIAFGDPDMPADYDQTRTDYDPKDTDSEERTR